MKLHILKIRPEYFCNVLYGVKRFELRKDDRDYEVGDIIHFINSTGDEFPTNQNDVFKITYILRDVPEYGLQQGYCILGIRKMEVARWTSKQH